MRMKGRNGEKDGRWGFVERELEELKREGWELMEVCGDGLEDCPVSFASLSQTQKYSLTLQKLHQKFNFSKGKVFSSLYFPLKNVSKGKEKEKEGEMGEREGGVLVLCAHHLVVDVVSWRVIFEELKEIFSNSLSPFCFSSSRPSLSFSEWAKKVDELKDQQQQQEIEYWTQEWKEAKKTAPFLWGLSPLYPLSNSQSLSIPLAIPTTTTLTSSMILQCLCTSALVAISYPQQQQLPRSLGIESHGRDPIMLPQQEEKQPNLLHPHSTIGWFTTILPLTLTPPSSSSSNSLAQFLKMVGEKIREREGMMGGGVGRGWENGYGGEFLAPFALVNYLGRGDDEGKREEGEWGMSFDGKWVGECVQKERFLFFLFLTIFVEFYNLVLIFFFFRGMISPVEITALFSPTTNELLVELLTTTSTTSNFSSNLFFTSLQTCLSLLLTPPSQSISLPHPPLSPIVESSFFSLPKEEVSKFLKVKNLEMFEIEDIFPLSPIQEVISSF